jgi:hypothetical protein
MTYQVFTPVRAQSLCVAAIFVFGLGAVPVAAADFETRLAPTDAAASPNPMRRRTGSVPKALPGPSLMATSMP